MITIKLKITQKEEDDGEEKDEEEEGEEDKLGHVDCFLEIFENKNVLITGQEVKTHVWQGKKIRMSEFVFCGK